MRKWQIVHNERGWSLNAERSWHYHKRAKIVKLWREFFCAQATLKGIPHCERIGVDVHTTFRTRQLQDPGNNFAAVKAAIDGLCDAGVIESDVARHVAWITFHSAEYVKGIDSVTLIVTEVA